MNTIKNYQLTRTDTVYVNEYNAITVRELNDVLKKMKNRKAPGQNKYGTYKIWKLEIQKGDGATAK